jgi:hypothetical protein
MSPNHSAQTLMIMDLTFWNNFSFMTQLDVSQRSKPARTHTLKTGAQHTQDGVWALPTLEMAFTEVIPVELVGNWVHRIRVA